jgi:octaprenyl-diphosphate synthase
LFEVACELGAALNGSTPALSSALGRYGLNLGTAYQIYDDCLDLTGEESAVGKTLRTDLERGKLTLPILNLLEAATDKQREKLCRLLVQKEPFDLSALANIADYEGALDRSVAHGGALLAEAREQLIGLPAGPYAEALEQVTWFLEDLLAKCRV